MLNCGGNKADEENQCIRELFWLVDPEQGFIHVLWRFRSNCCQFMTNR